jgi:hypothetical protein
MYKAEILWSKESAMRQMYTFYAQNAAEDLIYAAKGIDPLSATDEATARASIAGNMTLFLAAHLKLYADSQSFGVSSAPFTVPYITVVYYDQAGSPPTGTLTAINLIQAGLQYPLYLNRIAQMPLSNLSDDLDPNVHFLYANFFSSQNLHEMLSVNTGNGFATAALTQASLTKTQVLIYSSMSALLVLTAVALFLPILINIESAKDAIARRFVFLPIALRRMLYLQTLRRTRALKRNYVLDDEDDDDDDDGDGEEDGGGGTNYDDKKQTEMEEGGDGEGGDGNGNAEDDGIGQNINWEGFMAGQNDDGGGGGSGGGANSARNRARRSNSGAGGAATPTSVSTPSRRLSGPSAQRRLSASGASPATAGGARAWLPAALGWLLPGRRKAGGGEQDKAPYRKSCWSLAWLIIGFIGPLVALFVYFSVSFALALTKLSSTISLSSAGYASYARASCEPELTVDTRFLSYLYADRNYVQQRIFAGADTGVCIKWNADLLQYGMETASKAPPAPDDPVAADGSGPGDSRGMYSETTPIIETGKSPLLDAATNSIIYQAMYSDACVLLSTLSPLPGGLDGVLSVDAFLARCRAFHGGIVTQGLRTLLDEFVAATQRIIDRRQRARVGNSSDDKWGGNAGYSIPIVLYDYSQDNCTSNACSGTIAPFMGEVAAEVPEQPLDPVEQIDILNYRGVSAARALRGARASGGRFVSAAGQPPSSRACNRPHSKTLPAPSLACRTLSGTPAARGPPAGCRRAQCRSACSTRRAPTT